jgi:hypothetical protein
VDLDISGSEEGSAKGIKEKKTSSAELNKLQQVHFNNLHYLSGYHPDMIKTLKSTF